MHSPPHPCNGVHRAETRELLLAPLCSRQRGMVPYTAYATRTSSGREFGVHSRPLLWYLRAAIGVVGLCCQPPCYLRVKLDFVSLGIRGSPPSWPYIIASLKNLIGQTSGGQNFPSVLIVRLVKNNNTVFAQGFAQFPKIFLRCLSHAYWSFPGPFLRKKDGAICSSFLPCGTRHPSRSPLQAAGLLGSIPIRKALPALCGLEGLISYRWYSDYCPGSMKNKASPRALK